MKLKNIIVLCCTTILMTGCFGASNDPRQGGLFGYSPSEYEKRQEAKKQHLVYLEDETSKEKASTEYLEAERDAASQQLAHDKKTYNQLKQELDKQNKQLNSLKASSAAEQKKLDDLRQRQNNLSRNVNNLGTIDTADKRKELMRLQEEQRRLEEEAILLQTY